METNKIIKICNSIFNKELKRCKQELRYIKSKKEKRELYFCAIKSWKKGFMKQLKRHLSKLKQNPTT